MAFENFIFMPPRVLVIGGGHVNVGQGFPDKFKGVLVLPCRNIKGIAMWGILMDDDKTKVHGAVAMYGPCTVRDLKEGETKYWCRCGLSKNQPWCDGSHKDTGIKPLKWTVNKSQSLFFICACKQTRNPPYCDGHHVHAPLEVENRKKNCTRQDKHVDQCKLCNNCGWVPDF